MSWENTGDMAASLPDVSNEQTKAASPSADATTTVDPQAYGWVAKEAYDYEKYNKTSKELLEANQANQANGIESGDWESNAAIYEWNDDYGDVGPAFPELEQQLFGGDNQMRTGIKFST